jgi:asparagine synthase (glutamine-hydrolysing)
MPGLCGIGAVDGGSLDLRPMLAAMRHFPWHRDEAWHAGPCAAGRVAVEGTPAAAEHSVGTSGDVTVVLDGELYSRRAGPSSEPAALSLAKAWAVSGAASLCDVHGCFAAAVWDARRQTLCLVTDRFGMRPVYWTHRRGRLAFAAEIKALLTDPAVPRRLSERGVSQFFAFGQFLGDGTLYEAVHALPPAACLTWDARADTVTVSEYAGPFLGGHAEDDAGWLELIGERLVTAVARACADTDGLGLSLSGGLDARTVLGVTPRGTKLTCLSLGVPGGIDHRSAGRLAHLAGQPHHRQLLDGDFLGRFSELLEPVVRLTDGHYLDQGIVYATLPMYRDLGVRVLLRGHAGELMHMRKAYAFSMDASATALESSEALDDWLWQRLSHYMIGEVAPDVFAHGIAARIRESARASLSEAAKRFEGVRPVSQRIWHLFVRERLHRETALSLHMFRSFVEVRVPFLDPDLIDVLLAAPPHLKVGDDIQTAVLRKHRPEFLQVTNANTGAPMGAGELRVKVAHLRMRVLARLGVPGYQPYERLGLWLARDLHAMLRGVLLDEQFLDRGIFDRAAVERLLDEHRRRSRNHTYLLQAMLVFELGQRLSSSWPAGRGEAAALLPSTL